MRIVFDLSPVIQHSAGIGRYARELLSALVRLDQINEYRVFYCAPQGIERLDPPLDQIPAHAPRWSPKRWRMNVLLADWFGISMDRWLPPTDIFHATDYVLPPLRRARGLLTIYDLTPWLYPEYHLPLHRWYLRLKLPGFVRRADAIVVTSESTRHDLERLVSLAPDKINVICGGVGPAYRPIQDPAVLASVRAKYQLPSRYILYVGTLEPRKNLLTLIEAYRQLLQDMLQPPGLVIAGSKGWLYESIFKRVQVLGLEAQVHFIGWIPEIDLPALLGAAEVVAYPSLYEGFGLPPLEAMACGTPVICSNSSSLPEVVGEAGLLIPPQDVQAWTQALHHLLTDEHLRIELRARGPAQARQFTWERAARKTLALYEAIKRRKFGLR